jgi:REP element-mobilizing transposase RayT
MGRTRYKVYDRKEPHFVTFTILNWLPVFTRKESVDVVIDTLKYLRKSDKLKIYAYVFLENHLHMVLKSSDLVLSVQKFKSYTAKEIISLLKKAGASKLLEQFLFNKKSHKNQSRYQIWEEGYAPKMILGEEMMRNKIEYIHQNPVKRGFVDEPWHWRYSSARNYQGMDGLIDVDMDWF